MMIINWRNDGRWPLEEKLTVYSMPEWAPMSSALLGIHVSSCSVHVPKASMATTSLFIVQRHSVPSGATNAAEDHRQSRQVSLDFSCIASQACPEVFGGQQSTERVSLELKMMIGNLVMPKGIQHERHQYKPRHVRSGTCKPQILQDDKRVVVRFQASPEEE